MTLDPSTAALVEQMAAAGVPPLWELEPEQARGGGVLLAQMYGAGPEMHAVHAHSLSAYDRGEFEIRVLVPRPDPAAVIVYYHAGGWVLGNIDEYDTLGRTLAAASECAVVLVDYRKAPEHRYPAAVEDAWTALHWTVENIETIAGATVPVIVAGDSAGGNLAAVMALRARERGGPRIALQVLTCPVTDSDLENDSYTDPATQVVLRKEAMEWFWNHYQPDSARRVEPDASPLRSESLTGLPPAVVFTAEFDPLRDEGAAYARRLAESGVSVQHKRFDGLAHSFFSFVNVLPASKEAIGLVADAIARTLTTGADR